MPNDCMSGIIGGSHYSHGGNTQNFRLLTVLEYAVESKPVIASHLANNKQFQECLLRMFGDKLFDSPIIGPPKGISLPKKPAKKA